MLDFLCRLSLHSFLMENRCEWIQLIGNFSVIFSIKTPQIQIIQNSQHIFSNVFCGVAYSLEWQLRLNTFFSGNKWDFRLRLKIFARKWYEFWNFFSLQRLIISHAIQTATRLNEEIERCRVISEITFIAHHSLYRTGNFSL